MGMGNRKGTVEGRRGGVRSGKENEEEKGGK